MISQEPTTANDLEMLIKRLSRRGMHFIFDQAITKAV